MMGFESVAIGAIFGALAPSGMLAIVSTIELHLLLLAFVPIDRPHDALQWRVAGCENLAILESAPRCEAAGDVYVILSAARPFIPAVWAGGRWVEAEAIEHPSGWVLSLPQPVRGPYWVDALALDGARIGSVVLDVVEPRSRLEESTTERIDPDGLDADRHAPEPVKAALENMRPYNSQEDPQGAAELYRAAAQYFEAHGDTDGYETARSYGHYTLDLAGHYREAADLVDMVGVGERISSDAEFHASIPRARSAIYVGRPDLAQAHAAIAVRAATELRVPRYELWARSALAEAMQESGCTEKAGLEARRAYDLLFRVPRSDHADALANLSWIAYVGTELDPVGGRDARNYPGTALTLAEMSLEAGVTSLGLVNLGYAALQQGACDRAAETLGRLRETTVPGSLRSWVRLLGIRVDLCRGHRLRARRRIATELGRRQFPDVAALVRLASAELNIGTDPRLAEREYRASLRLAMRGDGEFGGSGATLAWVSAQRGLIDVLAAQGRCDAAMSVARRARRVELLRAYGLGALDAEAESKRQVAVRVFRRRREQIEAEWARGPGPQRRRMLEAEIATAVAAFEAELHGLSGGRRVESWAAPLRAPSAGEALLMVTPGRTAYWAFAKQAGESARCAELDVDLDTRGRAQRVLDLSGELRGPVETIRVLPTRAIGRVSLHTIAHRRSGRPWVEHAPFVYALDLPPREGGGDLDSALVVEDTRLDHVASGTIAMERRLVDRGLDVEMTDSLGHRQLLRRLQGVDLFHFDGHGYVESRGTLTGLRIPTGDHLLEATDVLALGRAPRRVVLSACESGVVAAACAREPIGVGQAFAIAGSEEVVVTTRAVEDSVAGRISMALAGQRGSLRMALQQAQIQVMETVSVAEWGAFRVVVP